MRTIIPILRNSVSSPLYLLVAAAIGASTFLLYHGLRDTEFVSTAQLRLNEIQINEQDQHLAHQNGAQQINTTALVKRIIDPNRAIALPWWYEFRTQALEATGISAKTNLDDKTLAKKILAHVSAKVLEDKKQFSISFTGNNPALSAILANALARSAITDATHLLEEKRVTYISFLEEQVRSAEQELQTTNAKLETEQQSVETFEAIEAWNKKQSAVQRVAALEHALGQLTEERIELETKLKSNTSTAQEVGEQEYQLAIQQRTLDLDLEISTHAKELGPKHPKMISLQAERTRLTQLIESQQRSSHLEANKLLAAFITQEDVLKKEILSLRSAQEHFERQSKSYADTKAELASLQDSKKWWSTQLAYARTQRGSFATPVSLQVPASIPTSSLNPLSHLHTLLCALLLTLIT